MEIELGHADHEPEPETEALKVVVPVKGDCPWGRSVTYLDWWPPT